MMRLKALDLRFMDTFLDQRRAVNLPCIEAEPVDVNIAQESLTSRIHRKINVAEVWAVSCTKETVS